MTKELVEKMKSLIIIVLTLLPLVAVADEKGQSNKQRLVQLEMRLERLESMLENLSRRLDSGRKLPYSDMPDGDYRKLFEEGRVRTWPNPHKTPNDKWREEEIRKIMKPRVGDRGPDDKYLKGFEYPYPKPCKENNWLGFGSEEAYNKAAEDFVGGPG